MNDNLISRKDAIEAIEAVTPRSDGPCTLALKIAVVLLEKLPPVARNVTITMPESMKHEIIKQIKDEAIVHYKFVGDEDDEK